MNSTTDENNEELLKIVLALSTLASMDSADGRWFNALSFMWRNAEECNAMMGLTI